MLIPIKHFLRFFKEVPTARALGLLLLMVLAGLSEGIGILLLVPMLEMLESSQASENTAIRWLIEGLSGLGLPHSIGGLLIAFLLLVIFRSTVQYGCAVLGAVLQHRLVDQLRHRCFAALLGAEWRWLAAGRASDHATLLLADVNRVGMGLNFSLRLLAGTATIAAYLLAAFALSWKMTSLSLFSGGLVFLLLSGQRRRALQLGQELGKANKAMHANIHESLTGIKLAKILGNEQRHLSLFLQVMGRLRRQQLHFMAGTSLSQGLFQIGGALLLAGYLYVGLNIWHTPIAELLILVLIFSRLIPMFSSVQQQYHHLLHALPALQETDHLLKQSQLAAEPDISAEVLPWPVQHAICLEQATVRYTERDTSALDRISVCFPARTTTAVMGASGAGKSTLADVLMGLLKLDHGEMRIDDVVLDSVRRLQWRRSVAYVPQETFLFNDTIRNNLLWGHSEADDTDLHQALQRAAADFVFALPRQLDTPVGDGGIRLSGGERQRLALARALLKRPSLLILDEATSALDMENEARVLTAIENLHGDLTVVIIGHRLATLEHADQVVILDDGRIAAHGNWAEVQSKIVAIP